MSRVAIFIGAFFSALVVNVLGALVAGTFVWFLWPGAIPALFPLWVAQGAISKQPAWETCVCFALMVGMVLQMANNRITVK